MMDGISEQDLLELSDRIVFHEAMAEKLGSYKQQTDDSELRGLLWRHEQIVLKQCEDLKTVVRAMQRQSGWQAYHRYTVGQDSKGAGR